jgi:nucleoside-diphosphate-sugar epimerase
VDAVVRTVDRRAELPDETILLIGEEETPSYDEMQKRIGRLLHDADWSTLVLPKGLAKLGSWIQSDVLDEDTDIKPWMIENSDDHYEIDVSRARRLLGWEPRHSLTRTLPEMIRRLRPAAVAASRPELEQAK